MGDSGSLFLGFMMVWCVIASSQGAQPIAHPMTMVWIMGVPLFDFVRLFFIRIMTGNSPLMADRQHIHHLLKDNGFSKCQALMVLCLFSITLGAIGVLADWFKMPESVMFFSFLILFVGFIKAASWLDARRHNKFVLPDAMESERV